MAAKPTSVPRWAQTTGGVLVAGANAPLAPNSGKLDVGFAPGEKPPAPFLNWLLNTIYLWTLYLQDAIFVATAASGLDGLKATGDGAASGVNGIGGATSGYGAQGTGGAPNGGGLRGLGTGTGTGVTGTGGATSGTGGVFTGGGPNGIGVTAQGTGAGQGLQAIAGGGAAPVTGALNLAPQNAPSAPANGDIWITTASVFARIAAATKTLAALETAQTWTAIQSFLGLSINGTTVPRPSYGTLINQGGIGGTPPQGTLVNSVSAAGTWFTYIISLIAGPSLNMTLNTAAGTITVADAGSYLVSFSVIVGPSAAGQALAARIAVNGAQPANGPVAETTSNAGATTTNTTAVLLASSGIITLAANDVVSLQVLANTTNQPLGAGALTLSRVG